MSADRWTYCPKCQENKEKTIERLKQEKTESYGKVSFEQYAELDRKITEIETGDKTKQCYELTRYREDYTIGLEGDEFMVSYSGKCTDCGFTHKFSFTENVLKTL